MSMRPPRSSAPGAQAKVLGSLSKSGHCLTLDELADELGVKRDRITWAVSRLITNKFVRRADRGCYEVTKAGIAAHAKGYRPGPQRANTGRSAPAKNTLRSRIWRTMRLRKRATIPEILENAASGDEKNAYANVLKYLGALKRAGYVKELARREQGTAPESNGHKVWLLVKDTGPLPPVVRKGGLYDANSEEDITFIGGGA